LEASQFVETIEKRQVYKIACLEEIGLNQGWLAKEQFLQQADQLKKNGYGQYLLDILKDAK
jgi:glucose-1-phosphate thymidylyltransferase